MALFRHGGARTRKLVAYLKRRAKGRPAERPSMDTKSYPALFRKRAIVFTDTADFTLRTAQDGILHFLMVFERVAEEAAAFYLGFCDVVHRSVLADFRRGRSGRGGRYRVRQRQDLDR